MTMPETDDCNALVSKELLQELLCKIAGHHSNFNPNKRFYAATGINGKRWAKLYRGELSITIDELKKLCGYIGVKFSAETFARQLSLFE